MGFIGRKKNYRKNQNRKNKRKNLKRIIKKYFKNITFPFTIQNVIHCVFIKSLKILFLDQYNQGMWDNDTSKNSRKIHEISLSQVDKIIARTSELARKILFHSVTIATPFLNKKHVHFVYVNLSRRFSSRKIIRKNILFEIVI